MSVLYFLLLILALLTIAVTWVVTASCAICWYEYANRDPELLAQRRLPERTLLAFRLVTMEIAAVLASLLQYPFGWLPPRPPLAESFAERPVLLLHGLLQNRACWFWMQRELGFAGFRAVRTINLPPWEHLEQLTDRLDAAVKELCEIYETDKVHLVCHSMGGIVARNYIQLHNGAGRIDRCILIATPNQGSKLAPLAVSPLGELVMPGSEFLAELNAAPMPPAVATSVILTHHDNIVLPWENARLEGAETIEFDWIGHTTLLYDSEAIRAVISTLRGART